MKLYLVIFILVFFMQTGCVSKTQIINEGDLCGVVIDENNKPVPNFEVICSSNLLVGKSSYTNNSGIFIIPDLTIGEYTINGTKENYAKFCEEKFMFRGSQSMFCCQVSSLKAILKRVQQNIKNQDYKKAFMLLEEIHTSKGGENEALILLYKTYISYLSGDIEFYEKYKKELKKNKNSLLNKIFTEKEFAVYE